MAETFQPNVPWHRLHDPPVHPGAPLAPWTVRPSSLQEIIDTCKRDPDRGRLHAPGSHWALSEAARSDSVFIETHDPDDGHEALGHTLWNVIPHAMDASRREWMAQQQHPTATYVHIESGIIGDDWSQDEADPPLPGGGRHRRSPSPPRPGWSARSARERWPTRAHHHPVCSSPAAPG